MDIVFWLALILMILGIIGSMLPIVPGPILSFLGLLLFYIFQEEKMLSLWAIIFFAFGIAILFICEYIFPILGAKLSGASKKGQWGAVLGALIGLIIFPPFGIFVGAVLGAVAGETQDGKKMSEAMRAALGVLVGGVASIFLQVIFSLSAVVYFLAKTA